MSTHRAPAGLGTALRAGLRWLYRTAQPPDALVARSGATLRTRDRTLRFVPVSAATGTPLIVVDLLDIHWRARALSPPLNALPTDELPSLATELAALGIPAAARHYHPITGTIVLDVPAHPTLVAAVRRHDLLRDAGNACGRPAEEHGRAIWPHLEDADTEPAMTDAPMTRTPRRVRASRRSGPHRATMAEHRDTAARSRRPQRIRPP